MPLVLMAASLACNRAPENKEAVREGVIEHLNKNTGLDLKSMDVAVDNVTFQGNRATASVSFKPKSSPDAGMTMNYSLERNGKKWVVQKTAGGHGGGSAMPSPVPERFLPDILPPVKTVEPKAKLRGLAARASSGCAPNGSAQEINVANRCTRGRSSRVVHGRETCACRNARHSD